MGCACTKKPKPKPEKVVDQTEPPPKPVIDKPEPIFPLQSQLIHPIGPDNLIIKVVAEGEFPAIMHVEPIVRQVGPFHRSIRDSLDSEAERTLITTSLLKINQDLTPLVEFLGEEEIKNLLALSTTDGAIMLIKLTTLNAGDFLKILSAKTSTKILVNGFSCYQAKHQGKLINVVVMDIASHNRKETLQLKRAKDLIILKILLEKSKNWKIVLLLDHQFFNDENQLEPYINSEMIKFLLKNQNLSKLYFFINDMPSANRAENEKKFKELCQDRIDDGKLKDEYSELKKYLLEDIMEKLNTEDRVCLYPRSGSYEAGNIKTMEAFINASLDKKEFIAHKFYDHSYLLKIINNISSDIIATVQKGIKEKPEKFAQINEFIKDLEILFKTLNLREQERELRRLLTEVWETTSEKTENVLKIIRLESMSNSNFTIKTEHLDEFKKALMRARSFSETSFNRKMSINKRAYEDLEYLFVENYVDRLDKFLKENLDEDDEKCKIIESNLKSLGEVFPKLSYLLENFYHKRSSNIEDLNKKARLILEKETLSSADIKDFDKLLTDLVAYKKRFERDGGDRLRWIRSIENDLEDRMEKQLKKFLFNDNISEFLEKDPKNFETLREEHFKRFQASFQILIECKAVENIGQIKQFIDEIKEKAPRVLSHLSQEIKGLRNRGDHQRAEKKSELYVKIRELPLVNTLKIVDPFVPGSEETDIQELIEESKLYFEGENPEMMEGINSKFSAFKSLWRLANNEELNSKMKDVQNSLMTSFEVSIKSGWQMDSRKTWRPAYIVAVLYSAHTIIFKDEVIHSLVGNFSKNDLEVFLKERIEEIKNINNKSIALAEILDAIDLKDDEVSQTLNRLERTRTLLFEFNYFASDFSKVIKEGNLEDFLKNLDQKKRDLKGGDVNTKLVKGKEFLEKNITDCLEKMQNHEHMKKFKNGYEKAQLLMEILQISGFKEGKSISDFFLSEYKHFEEKLAFFENEKNMSRDQKIRQIGQILEILKDYSKVDSGIEKFRLSILKRELLEAFKDKALKEKRIWYEFFESDDAEQIVENVKQAGDKIRESQQEIDIIIPKIETFIKNSKEKTFSSLSEKFQKLYKDIKTQDQQNIDAQLENWEIEEFVRLFMSSRKDAFFNKNQSENIIKKIELLKKDLDSEEEGKKILAFERSSRFLNVEWGDMISEELHEKLNQLENKVKEIRKKGKEKTKYSIQRQWEGENYLEAIVELCEGKIKADALPDKEKSEMEKELGKFEKELIESLEAGIKGEQAGRKTRLLLKSIEEKTKEQGLDEKLKSELQDVARRVRKDHISSNIDSQLKEMHAEIRSFRFKGVFHHLKSDDDYRILAKAVKLNEEVADTITNLKQSAKMSDLSELYRDVTLKINKFVMDFGESFQKSIKEIKEIDEKEKGNSTLDFFFKLNEESAAQKCPEILRKMGECISDILSKTVEEFFDDVSGEEHPENFLLIFIQRIKSLEERQKSKDGSENFLKVEELAASIKTNTVNILNDLLIDDAYSIKVTNVFKYVLIPIVEATTASKSKESAFLEMLKETDIQEAIRAKFGDLDSHLGLIHDKIRENLEANKFNPETFKAALKAGNKWKELNEFLVEKRPKCQKYQFFRWNGVVSLGEFVLEKLNAMIHGLENYTKDRNHLTRSTDQFDGIIAFKEHYDLIHNLLMKAKNITEITSSLSDQKVKIPDQKKIAQIASEYKKKVDEFWKSFSQAVNKILNKKPTEFSKTDFAELENFYKHSTFFLDSKCDYDFKEIEDYREKIENFPNKLSHSDNRPKDNTDVSEIVKFLIFCKEFLNGFHFLGGTRHNGIIDEYLNEILSREKVLVLKIAKGLREEATGLGLQIIEEHPIFEAERNRLFEQAMKYNNFEDLIKKVLVEGENTDFTNKSAADLTKFYKIYEKDYKEHLTKYIEIAVKEKGDSFLKPLIESIQSKFQGLDPADPNFLGIFPQNKEDLLPKIIAEICTLWSVERAEFLFGNEDKSDSFDGIPKPHAGQILCLFRMFGLGFDGSNQRLENNLVELQTGEGKSMVLAVSSIIFALRGFKVYCACYSKYLSDRDKSAFSSLFAKLEVDNKIEYGTFNELCENVINEEANLRSQLEEIIKGGQNIAEFKSSGEKKVLLIDEVDVLFDTKYIATGYSIATPIRDSTISAMIEYIYSQKDKKMNEIKETNQYKKLREKFPKWEKLIDNSIRLMMNDVNKEFPGDYQIHDGKIGFYENGVFVTNKQLRYITAYLHIRAYFNEKISKPTMDNALFMSVNGGTFSYLEIAKEFKFILGVTGTLKELNKSQKMLIEDLTYLGIKRRTFIPSVFDNIRNFNKNSDFKIFESLEDWHENISIRIQNALKENRAVICFFENHSALTGFKDYANDKKSFDKKILTERTEISDKNHFIKTAGTRCNLILATREMGRGVDFLARDKEVQNNGGILVIQTFPSEEKSEEVQIRGRCARQGQKGSFCLILHLPKLSLFNLSKSDTYAQFCEKREIAFEKKLQGLKKTVDELKEDHALSVQFKQALKDRKLDELTELIIKLNRLKIQPKETRTLILIDATNTMEDVIGGLKNNLSSIFDECTKQLELERIKKGLIKIQIAAYRDYDVGIDDILEVSEWGDVPKDLISFLDKIKAKGGGDIPEAVEVGLWHANEVSKDGELTQVFLIADAPSKSLDEVKNDRNKNNKFDWEKKFGPPTSWKEQCEILAARKIPVHTIYLLEEEFVKATYKNDKDYKEILDTAKNLKRNFEQISEMTGGKSYFINETEAGDVKSKVLQEYLIVYLLKSIDPELISNFQMAFSYL